MILPIGEILADVICNKGDENLIMEGFIGGASFNVSANAKYCGANVGLLDALAML